MASDCRIGFRLNLFSVLILKVLLAHVLLLGILLNSNQILVQSAVFDPCERVQNCTCSKIDYYTVECPDDQLYPVHPITAKVHAEGVLELICDYAKPDFEWRHLRGLDFNREDHPYEVSTLTISQCPIPPENDGLAELLKHLNIDPRSVKRFKFASFRTLTTFPDYMLAPLVNLTVLDLSRNSLTSIPNLAYFPGLQQFEFHSNLITSLTASTFSSNGQLQRVQLRNNNLATIEDSCFPDSLDQLDLISNRISKITRNTFSNLVNLRVLYLNSNPLDDLDPFAFSNLRKLGGLWLDAASFQTFPVLKELQTLENVSMSYNPYFQSLTAGDLINPRRQSTVPMTVTDVITPINYNDGGMGSNFASGSSGQNVNNNGTSAVLSSESLGAISDLPALSYLALVKNGFLELPKLQNLPNLTNLVLSQNKIQRIPPNAFSSFPALRKLDLSQNEITELASIQTVNLVELDLSRNSISEIDKSTLQELANLEKLSLATNKISYIDPKAFVALVKLKDLNLANNLINFAVPSSLGKQFDVAYSQGYSPLRFCTNLQQLDLSQNSITSIYEDFRTNLLDLSKLNLRFNKLTSLKSEELGFAQSKLDLDLRNNEIEMVDLTYFAAVIEQKNRILVRLGGNPLKCDCAVVPFKTLSSEVVKFDTNDLNCAGPQFPKNLSNLPFQSVPKEDLVCPLGEEHGCPDECTCWRRPSDYTVLVGCDGKYSNGNFSLPDMKSVSLRGYLYANKYEIVLDLTGNEIVEIPPEYAKSISNRVRTVDLRGNKLRSLSFLKALTDNNITRFNLSDNPFSCYDCNFLTDSRSQFSRIADGDNLTCRIEGSRPEHVQKALDFDYESICSVHLVGVIIPIVVTAVFLVVVTIVYVRNGWAIRAYLYSKGYGFLLCDKYMEDDQEKLYDAFVSYSHRDEAWVLEELVQRLESEEGFKLCLHFRDWTPGDWIPDQIVRSVDQSRRTVVVLSKNFVESVWSRLEFKAAHSQALSDRSNRLILVLMGEDLTEKDVKDDDLRVYMKMNTYIKWNDPWFWHKLKYALPHRKCLVEENRNHYVKRVQRERAIQLDKIRTKMENQVSA